MPLAPRGGRKPAWLAAAGMACVLLFALFWFQRNPAPSSSKAPLHLAPPIQGDALAPSGEEGELEPGDPDDPARSRLPSESDVRRERDEQAVDGLIDLLAGKSGLPDAKQLQQTFMQELYGERRLAEAMERRKQSPTTSSKPLRAFLRELKDFPEFRRLAARFAQAAASSARLPVAASRSTDRAGGAAGGALPPSMEVALRGEHAQRVRGPGGAQRRREAESHRRRRTRRLAIADQVFERAAPAHAQARSPRGRKQDGR